MHRIFLILVLAAGLSACASTATDATAEGGSYAITAAETKKPKKSCYREKVTGTRLGIRICKTVDE